MENTIATIHILDIVRLVHGYFIFVLFIINMLSSGQTGFGAKRPGFREI
jgi:hypothetical protein